MDCNKIFARKAAYMPRTVKVLQKEKRQQDDEISEKLCMSLICPEDAQIMWLSEMY